MKLFSQLLVLGLAAEVTVGSSWFGKAGMFNFIIYSHYDATASPLCFHPSKLKGIYTLCSSTI
jgi:hypothetical protein